LLSLSLQPLFVLATLHCLTTAAADCTHSLISLTHWLAALLSLRLQPRWQDLFTLFPSLVGRIPLETFFELMPLVKPRYYR
jgi:hypothetical protein